MTSINHRDAVKIAVDKLEEIVEDLEKELRRREADLKVMRLMYAQCNSEGEPPNDYT